MRKLTSLEHIEGEWIIDSSGNRYKEDENGDLHCENGPAFISYTGNKHWYIHGNKHREDGPATEYENGYRGWWLNGNWIHVDSQEEFERFMKLELFW